MSKSSGTLDSNPGLLATAANMAAGAAKWAYSSATGDQGVKEGRSLK